ncbi:Flp family type IVb pilin [Thaumasiovibrio subtropicus]|uniref:Flp family type IVb pilin n=1 Tax=Thaumasiovibrio subtropicus TaxID=1891207 RepID=UPI000B357D5F|nr:Flp family type IVb pilin [Thaumasiovibrio subtropicus]
MSLLNKLGAKAIYVMEAFRRDQRGVTAIEYAVIAVAVAAVVVAVFSSGGNPLQNALNNAMADVETQINNAN